MQADLTRTQARSYARAVLRAVAGEPINQRDLEVLKSSLERAIFGSRVPSELILRSKRSTITLLDVTLCISLVNSSGRVELSSITLPSRDFSDVWWRASILTSARKYGEAALEYLTSAVLSRGIEGTEEAVSDQDEWTRSCLSHAAKNLIAAQYLLSGALLLSEVEVSDRNPLANRILRLVREVQNHDA